MEVFSKEELSEAARAIDSTRMKSEKAILKLKEGTAQYRLTARGIAAYSLALQLLAREQGEPHEPILCAKESLHQANEAFAFAATRVESVLPKFAAGTGSWQWPAGAYPPGNPRVKPCRYRQEASVL